MLQSHAKQLQTKYMTILRRETDLRPEDIGAMRLAIGMALSEMQDEHRQQLNEMDDIMADLLEERDQLKAAAGTDAGEILRLQTMEDRLVSWLNAHEPVTNCDDVAAVVIDVLTKYRASCATLVPAYVNGNGNGHVTVREHRLDGRRVNVDVDALREQALTTLRNLAAQLGHTPTQREFEQMTSVDIPSIQTIKKKLGCTYNDLVDASGLERNKSIIETRKEAKAENAEAPFRGE
jgi:hypothetical protein